MGISDWSSDVCSPDLLENGHAAERPADPPATEPLCHPVERVHGLERAITGHPTTVPLSRRPRRGDRKSVVSGKCVSVRVDLGGRRIMKTKQSNLYTERCTRRHKHDAAPQTRQK